MTGTRVDTKNQTITMLIPEDMKNHSELKQAGNIFQIQCKIRILKHFISEEEFQLQFIPIYLSNNPDTKLDEKLDELILTALNHVPKYNTGVDIPQKVKLATIEGFYIQTKNDKPMDLLSHIKIVYGYDTPIGIALVDWLYQSEMKFYGLKIDSCA